MFIQSYDTQYPRVHADKKRVEHVILNAKPFLALFYRMMYNSQMGSIVYYKLICYKGSVRIS